MLQSVSDELKSDLLDKDPRLLGFIDLWYHQDVFDPFSPCLMSFSTWSYECAFDLYKRETNMSSKYDLMMCDMLIMDHAVCT